jgi:hypothetical protein
MASLIEKHVNDVGTSGQNTSPDSNKNHIGNKKATREVALEKWLYDGSLSDSC